MPNVQAGAINIHYQKSGQGEALVFLHGMSNNSNSWANQLEQLSDDFTVIAWDAPGYGQSSDPTEPYQTFHDFSLVLKDFLDALHLTKIHLLGHSMGAAIAVDFAVHYPEMLKSLILADITRGAAALSKEENEKRLYARLNNIDSKDPSEIANQRIKALLSPNASDEVREKVKFIMSQVRPAGYKSVAYSLSNLNQMDQYGLIETPTMIICGELDQVTPVHESKVVHELIPDSKMRTIPETGHLCYQEDPAEFNQIINEFISEVNKKG